MGVRSAGFTILILLGSLTTQLGLADGATLSCVQTEVITGADWGDALPKRLHDLGFSPPVRPLCATVMLSGDIEKDDANKLEALLQANLPFLGRIALKSNGGSVAEAMQIGRVVRRYYLATEAPTTMYGQRPSWLFGGKITDAPNAICASACFFAWLGGVNRTGNILGIHRPFPSMTEMQKLSPAEAQVLYRDLSDKIRAYLAEMDAAPHWLSDMMRIPSDDLYMIPEKQVQDELEGNDRALFDIPSIAQWKFAKCGGLSVAEWDDLKSAAWKAANGTLPKRQEGYHNYLEHRLQEVNQCGHQAVVVARWELRATVSRN